MVVKGYKQTEIGVIPEDWDVSALQDIATLINGRAYKQSELLLRGKYPVLRVGNFFTNDSWYYSDLDLEEKFYCDKGDLLFAWSCTYGAYIWDKEKTIFHYHIWKVLCKNVSSTMLYYILNSDIDKQKRASHGGTMSHITKGFMETRLYAIPSTLEEQTAIATALSDIDDLISSLEKLIAKKQSIKQGAMQELLTGKKRLDGFSGEWENVTLGDIAEIKDGTHGTFQRTDNGYLLLSAKNVLNNKLQLSQNESMISKRDYELIINCGFPKYGDILLSCVGTIGRCCIYLANPEVAFQRSVAFIRTKGNNNIFILYMLQSNAVQEQLKQSANASAQGGVYLGSLNVISITIPKDKEEQTAIATILSDMDSEIDELKTKLEKYKQIKQGMMSELLTGKIRFI